MFAWRRGAIRAALEKYTPLPMLIDQAVGSDLALANAYERITPISIDRAVMESAAADHRVVMGAMDVGWSDLGSWTALLAAIAGDRVDGATGRVVQTGETIDVGADDLVVRPVGGRLVVEAGPAVAAGAGGTIVADGVWAHLAGARHLDRRGPRPARPGRPRGGPRVTIIAEAPTPTTIVFGTDGWRARVADDFTFENVRRCADGVARYVVGRGAAGEGRRRRVRPAVRLGALRRRRRRGPPRPRHPGLPRDPRRPDPDELVRGRRARAPRPGS